MNKLKEKPCKKNNEVIAGNISYVNSNGNNTTFDEKYWSSNYESGNIGWDIGEVSPPIKNYADQIKDKNISILIPGCGNAYEAEYLCDIGFKNISLLDFSKVLADDLKIKFAFNNNIKVICEDYFDHEGKYDLIIEQTFFCAINPEIREEYLKKMTSLLKDTGKLIGVLFDREFEKAGPPYGGSKKEYEKLFEKYFDIKLIEECYNSFPPRSGNELFINIKQKNI